MSITIENTRVLIACECRGMVREAFRAWGFDAWSCDLKPAEDNSPYHLQGDVRDYLSLDWHLMIAHPVCKRLTNAGVRWLSKPPPGKTIEGMWAELQTGVDLFSDVWNADIKCKAIENPVMHYHAKNRIVNYRPFAQSLQPWQFGDPEKKRTCWWLHNLSPLKPTHTMADYAPGEVKARVHLMPPGPEREAERSRFFPGMSANLALQWGFEALSKREY